MKSQHEWVWKGSSNIPPQKSVAGQVWEFSLPISGRGSPPHCQWLNLPWESQDHLSAQNSHNLKIRIPPSLSGVYQIRYRIQLSQLVEGSIVLKVVNAEDTSKWGKTDESLALPMTSQTTIDPLSHNESSSFKLFQGVRGEIRTSIHYSNRYQLTKLIRESSKAYLFQAIDRRLYGKKVWLKLAAYDSEKFTSDPNQLAGYLEQQQAPIHQESQTLLHCHQRQLSGVPIFLDYGMAESIHLQDTIRRSFPETWETILTEEGQIVGKQEPFVVMGAVQGVHLSDLPNDHEVFREKQRYAKSFIAQVGKILTRCHQPMMTNGQKYGISVGALDLKQFQLSGAHVWQLWDVSSFRKIPLESDVAMEQWYQVLRQDCIQWSQCVLGILTGNWKGVSLPQSTEGWKALNLTLPWKDWFSQAWEVPHDSQRLLQELIQASFSLK